MPRIQEGNSQDSPGAASKGSCAGASDKVQKLSGLTKQTAEVGLLDIFQTIPNSKQREEEKESEPLTESQNECGKKGPCPWVAMPGGREASTPVKVQIRP